MRLFFCFPILSMLLLTPTSQGRQLPPPPGPTPYITANPFAPVHAGQAFSYQIDATDTTNYAAEGLPVGLGVDAATGLISGMPLVAGTFDVTLVVSNYYTSNSATLTLTVGPEFPTLSIAATHPLVVIGSGGHGAVKVRRTGDLTQPLTVTVTIAGSAVNGTDYKAISGTLVLAPNQTSANLRIVPASGVPETAVKTVKLKLLPGDGYQIGTASKTKVTIVPAG